MVRPVDRLEGCVERLDCTVGLETLRDWDGLTIEDLGLGDVDIRVDGVVLGADCRDVFRSEERGVETTEEDRDAEGSDLTDDLDDVAVLR